MPFYPPTPTPFLVDPEAQLIELPAMSLWHNTDEAIQAWNMVPEYTTFFQAFILIAVVVGVIMLIRARFTKATDK